MITIGMVIAIGTYGAMIFKQPVCRESEGVTRKRRNGAGSLLIAYLPLRSPWSNEYDPPLEDGTVPSPKLRKLEITANEAFDTYREM